MAETTYMGVAPSDTLLLDISNALVGLHKELYGRGPTKARTYVMDDLIAVVMQGGYSRAEHTLLQHGRGAAVTEIRLAMHDTIEQTSIATIQRLTGRTVRSFMSAHDPAQDLEAELFLLDPEEGMAPAPADPLGLAARAQSAVEQSEQVREDLRALRAEQLQCRTALRRQRERRE